MNGFMIERESDGPNTVFRLSGRIEAEHIPQLRSEIEGQTGVTSLHLDQVKLVSVEVIQFLGTCEAQGIELRNCPTYVREWISKARDDPREQT
jgi:hypothetical protein